jgi:hypothetical protein
MSSQLPELTPSGEDKKVKSWIATLASLIVSGPAFAIDVSSCDPALVRMTYKATSKSSSDFRLSNLVDETTYKGLTKNMKGTGYLYGVPVGASYDDYQQNWMHLHRDLKVSLSAEESRSVAWTGVPLENSDYGKCLAALVSIATTGITLTPKSATENDILVEVTWRVPQGTALLEVDAVWAASDEKLLILPPAKLKNGATSFLVKRPVTGSINVFVNVQQQFSDHLVVAAYSPPPPLPPTPNKDTYLAFCGKTAGPFECGNEFFNDAKHQPNGTTIPQNLFIAGGGQTYINCFHPDVGYRFDPASVRFWNWSVNGDGGKAAVTSNPVTNSEICVRADGTVGTGGQNSVGFGLIQVTQLPLN